MLFFNIRNCTAGLKLMDSGSFLQIPVQQSIVVCLKAGKGGTVCEIAVWLSIQLKTTTS